MHCIAWVTRIDATPRKKLFAPYSAGAIHFQAQKRVPTKPTLHEQTFWYFAEQQLLLDMLVLCQEIQTTNTIPL